MAHEKPARHLADQRGRVSESVQEIKQM